MTGPAVPLRLQVGDAVYVAVPVAQARAVAYLLSVGADRLSQRDGVRGLPWLEELLGQLAAAQVEHPSNLDLSVPSSAARTGSDSAPEGDGPWSHDHVTIDEARRLTGWSAGYLARLGRAGLGVKRGGAWYLDRRAVLARRQLVG